MHKQNNRELLIEKYIPPTEEIYIYNKECWFDKNGELHSFNGQPAVISFFWNKERCVLSKEWYKNGIMHRDKGRPSYVSYFTNGEVFSKMWYKNGEFIKQD